jgi:hypothetical protein
MDQKIQLTHPAGKKAVSIDKGKYDVLKKALMNFLQTNGESTHAEIFRSLPENFKKNNIKFAGSIEWHLEWVILDLEARKEIKRLSVKPQIKFTFSNTSHEN